MSLRAFKTLAVAAALALSGCGGGSSTGGGTMDSPFVGRYNGSTTVTASTTAGRETATEPVSIFVNQDGLVQVGDAEGIIHASGPLMGNEVRIEVDASAVVDADCSGIIALAGTFSLQDDNGALFAGRWTSSNASCFGVSGEVSGPVNAERVSTQARASRVFETYNPALRRAYRQSSQ